MPELPEVESVRRGLVGLISGRVIEEVVVREKKSFALTPAEHQSLIGTGLVGFDRYAKLLVMRLSSDFALVVHLKMTGQLVLRDRSDPGRDWGGGHPTSSFLARLPDNTTRVIFRLGPPEQPTELFFNDLRKFGWIRLVPTTAVPELDFITQLGPEPLSRTGEPLSPAELASAEAEFRRRARRHQRAPIKAVILDQRVVGGIGNIYADEALWSAQVHPGARLWSLSDDQLGLIFREAAAAMLRSLSVGGSTMATYVRPDGNPGSYLDDFANVFRREGQACPRCATAIVKTRLAGRGTHFCPNCQPTTSRE